MPRDLSHSSFNCPKLRMHWDKRRPVDVYLMYCPVAAANQEAPKAVA